MYVLPPIRPRDEFVGGYTDWFTECIPLIIGYTVESLHYPQKFWGGHPPLTPSTAPVSHNLNILIQHTRILMST